MKVDPLKLAKQIGVSASWPTQIKVWSDILADHDPTFDREKFERRAMQWWEATYQPPEIDDHIPY